LEYSKQQIGQVTQVRASISAYGVFLLHDCTDGIERVFSHGGDALNNGFAHDAFDCYRILECGRDMGKALNWSSEITKHNQRLYMKDKAQQKKKQSTPVAGESKDV